MRKLKYKKENSEGLDEFREIKKTVSSASCFRVAWNYAMSWQVTKDENLEKWKEDKRVKKKEKQWHFVNGKITNSMRCMSNKSWNFLETIFVFASLFVS